MLMSHLPVPSVLGWAPVVTGARTTSAARPGEEDAPPGCSAGGSRGSSWFRLSPPQMRLRWALGGYRLGDTSLLFLVLIAAPGAGSSQRVLPHFLTLHLHLLPARSTLQPPLPTWSLKPHGDTSGSSCQESWGGEDRPHPAPHPRMCHPSPIHMGDSSPELAAGGAELGGGLGVMDARGTS